MTITKQEIQDWINFLYEDLQNDKVYIGGYYFYFPQLKDFNKIDNKINNSIKQKTKRLMSKITNLLTDTKFQNKPLENNEILKINITTKNKFNETRTFPCTQEEFYFIFNELEKAKQDVEHFKTYLLEELEQMEEENYSFFMVFINDLLQDTRDKFAGKTHNLKIE